MGIFQVRFLVATLLRLKSIGCFRISRNYYQSTKLFLVIIVLENMRWQADSSFDVKWNKGLSEQSATKEQGDANYKWD